MRARLPGFIIILLSFFVSSLQAQLAKFTVNGVKVNTNGTYNFCINDALVFSNSSVGAYNFLWKFENGNPASAFSPNVFVSFSKTGTHKVLVSFKDASNKDVSDSVNISVSDVYPKADFTYLPVALVCGNTEFNFNSSSSSGAGLIQAWTFGDGSKSTEANPKHAFVEAYGNGGTVNYSVGLTVKSNNGCTGFINKVVTVKQVPNADITSTDEKTVFPAGSDTTTFRNCDNKFSHEFTFTNASTTIASNTEYIINWGDGSAIITMAAWATTAPLKHTFPRGLSRMTVTVKNNAGCQTEKNYSIFVGSNPSGGFATDGSTAGLCAPSNVEFKINNTQDNGSGTRYTFTVSDGSAPVVMQHPPPDKVSHLFDRSSCGFVAVTGTNNAFYTTLSIENPCEPPTVLNISPIIVSGKPNPVIVTNPNVCINSNTSIGHNGDYGVIVTSANCSNVGKQVWAISPASGYTITGSLGNFNGDILNTSNWIDGSKNLPVVFSSTGNYTVTLYMANTRCGLDSTTQIICVRNPPTAVFSLDKKAGCAPAVATINNTSPVGPCGGEKYSWNIIYSDSEGCGASNGATYTNGTTSTNKNPQISFSSPGRYILELTVSANASGCVSPVARDTFYVSAKPLASISTIAALCAGNTIAPKATVSNCYDTQTAAYNWQFTGGIPASSTSSNPGNILYNNQGNYVITLDVANKCGTTTTNTTANITSKPIANAGTDKIVCSGKTASLGTIGAGYTYSWNPSTFLNNSSIAEPTITPLYNGPSGDSTLQYVLTVSAGANCVSTDTVLITVKKSPLVAVSPTATSICSGGSALLTASGADTYSWNPATGLNPTNLATTTASPAATATYTVTGNLANGCTNTASVTVNVVSFTAADAGANKNYCSGLSASIGTTDAGMNYSWSPVAGLSTPNSAVSTVNFINTGNSDTTLTYVLTASAGANCSSTDTVLVIVKRAPKTVVLPAVTDICPGGSAKLVASGATAYAWSPVSGLNVSNKDTVMANPSATQQYLVTGSFDNGCSADATAIVNVKAKPAVEAGADTTTCKNFSGIQLTGSPSGGSWSGNNFINSTGVFNPLLAGIGTFKAVYAFMANGCNNADSLVITVTNPPTASAGADASYCAGPGTVQLIGSPAGGTWSGSPIVSAAGIVQLTQAGIYSLAYHVGSGSCVGTDTVVITIGDAVSNNVIGTVLPVCTGNAPATITGAVATAGSYTVSYQWQQSTDSTNWTNILGASAKDYSPPELTASVFYRRLASSTLCSQGTSSNVIKSLVHPNALADFNPLKTSGCTAFQITPAIVNLSAYPARNGEYRWLVNSNYIGSGEQFPGYIITKSADTILLTLVAISRFGCINDTITKTFTTLPTPVPSFTISDSVGCGPLDISITNTTPDANLFSFTWDFGTGQKSSAVQPGLINFPINPGYGDTVYTVSLKAFTGCDTIEVTKSIRVRAKPKSLFTPSKVAGCSPMPVNFTNTSRGSNAGFTWDFGDGSAQVPATATSIQHTFLTGLLDTFFVKLFGQNDCGIDTQQYAIVVNPNAIKLNVAVNGNQLNGCAPHSVLFVNNTRGANLFRWDFGDGNPGLVTTKGVDTVFHTYTQPGSYNVTLFATNSCSDTSTSLKIIVETKPLVAFTATPQVLCIGQPITIANTSENGLAWAWRFGDGSTSSVQNPVKSYSLPGNYRIVLKGTKSFAQGFGCADSAFADIIIKDTLPGNFIVDSTGSCAPMLVTFKNTNLPAAKTTWIFGDGAIGVGDSVTHIFRNEGRYAVVMLSQAAGGCSYRNEKTIVVNGPSGELRYQGGYICPPNTIQFEVISNNTSQYRFYFGNGDSLITTNPIINYTYKKPGAYLPFVVLVTGNCSRLLKGIDSVKIEAVSAGFKTNTLYSCGITNVSFTDTSVAYFTLNKWEWSFGDGTSSLLRNPVKQFTTPGSYQVELRVTSVSGCTAQATFTVVVQVRNKPVSQISNSQLLCTSNSIAFTAKVSSADSIAASNWSFGNGATATGNMVAYTYANTGVFTVSLISRTVFGCADTVKKIITISQSPLVKAGPDLRLCLGQSAQLIATGASQTQWSPSQGLSCTSCTNPVAKPTVSTRYVVTGTNAIGCPNSDSILVEVVQPFTISVNGNDTICIGQSSQLFVSGAATYRWNPAVGLSAGNVPNPIARPLTTTAYTVVGFDAYNCFTDTAFVTVAVGKYPVIDLGNGGLVVAGTAVQLNPILTNGPFKSYTWSPTSLLSCINCPNPVATINNNNTYQLSAQNIYGCSGSDTISYQVLCSKDDQVYIPNAFSPDGDGINDVFMVQGKGVLVDYFRVFNRWGQLVFDGGSNYRPNEPAYGWNGKINGKPATQDVYVYTVQVRCTAGGSFTYKGNVSLLYMR